MNKTRSLEVLGVAIADVSTTCLEVPAVRARGNFLVRVVARQPNLQVIGLAAGESNVARAKADHAVRQLELLKNVLGVVNHGFQIVLRFLGLGEFHHFHLAELVHANNAARVATSSARLGAEAGRKCAVLQRQLACI